MESLIFTFVIIAIIESIFSARWHSGYFQRGVLIYSKRYPYGGTADTSIEEAVLNEAFKKSFTSSLVFKEIEPNIFAFREKFFDFKFITYTPIMHGRLEIKKSTREIVVVDLLNWWIIAFVLTFLIFSGVDIGFIPFLAIVLGAIYLFQKGKYDKVGEFAYEWNSRDWTCHN
jgi:hypothetical protein